MNPLQPVVSVAEEWRTKGNRRFPRGRAMLWIGLACGDYVQRMRRLERDGTVRAPSRCRCESCGERLSSGA